MLSVREFRFRATPVIRQSRLAAYRLQHCKTPKQVSRSHYIFMHVENLTSSFYSVMSVFIKIIKRGNFGDFFSLILGFTRGAC